MSKSEIKASIKPTEAEWLRNFFEKTYKKNFVLGSGIAKSEVRDDGTFFFEFAQEALIDDAEDLELMIKKYLNHCISLGLNLDLSISIVDEYDKISLKCKINQCNEFEKIRDAMALFKDNFYVLKDGKYAGLIPALKMEGLLLVNKYHGLKNVFVCENNDLFNKTLELLKSDGLPDNFDLMLVRQFPGGHVQPIKIERREGKNNVIVTDSIAGDRMQDTIDIVGQILPEAHIYYSKTCRQKSDFGCYVITSRDLDKMAQNPDLAGTFEKGNLDENPQGKLHCCEMPEEFFMMAQSRKDVEEYYRKTEKGESGVLKRGLVYRTRTTLDLTTPYQNDSGEIPGALDHFSKKYGQVIDIALVTLSFDQLQIIISEVDASKLNKEALCKMGVIQKEEINKEDKWSPKLQPSQTMHHPEMQPINGINSKQEDSGCVIG